MVTSFWWLSISVNIDGCSIVNGISYETFFCLCSLIVSWGTLRFTYFIVEYCYYHMFPFWLICPCAIFIDSLLFVEHSENFFQYSPMSKFCWCQFVIKKDSSIPCRFHFFKNLCHLCCFGENPIDCFSTVSIGTIPV